MTAITDTIVGVLLAEHNARYDQGIERDYFAAPSLWMVRRAERIAAAIEPEIRADECRKAAEVIDAATDADGNVCWHDTEGDPHIETPAVYLRYRSGQHEKERP